MKTRKRFKQNIAVNNFGFVSTTTPSDLNILETKHVHKEIQL